MSSLIKKFIALSFPLKFIIGAIFGIIAGPGLLAFLSEYATYAYAIRINIRPPLEGIPYLSASVALASLVLSITAIGIFLFTRWLVTRMVNYPINNVRDIFKIFDTLEISKIQSGEVVEKSIKSLKDLKAKKALLVIVISALTITLVIYGIAQFASFISDAKGLKIKELIIVFTYFFVVLLSLWKPIINWIIAISFAILFYLFSFKLLFNIDYYSNYLRLIKYGGSINISLEYKDTKKSEAVTLLLRTRDYLFIQRNNSIQAIELPLENVRSITYR